MEFNEDFGIGRVVLLYLVGDSLKDTADWVCERYGFKGYQQVKGYVSLARDSHALYVVKTALGIGRYVTKMQVEESSFNEIWCNLR